MKLLYILYFKAPMGGLHENVYSSALFMKKKKCDVYVVLKPGLLQQRLEAKGIRTISTDFSDTNDTVSKIEAVAINFDLIHFHPGPSKTSALKYGRKHNIPMVETFHGMWHDHLNKYIRHLSAVVTVSEGIRNYLQSRIKNYHEKYTVLANGYDPKLFRQPCFYKHDQEELTIGLITRLDHDKQFILDIYVLAAAHIRNKEAVKINFHVIGEGAYREDFLQLLHKILEGSPHTIVYKGWLTDRELARAYMESDIVMAPGRSAIEGMVSGKPVIAVGSKKYIGLIHHNNWQEGLYRNFGGFGNKFNDYVLGSVEADLDLLLDAPKNIRTIGEFSHEIAKRYFNADEINGRLYGLYKSLVQSKHVSDQIGSSPRLNE